MSPVTEAPLHSSSFSRGQAQQRLISVAAMAPLAPHACKRRFILILQSVIMATWPPTSLTPQGGRGQGWNAMGTGACSGKHQCVLLPGYYRLTRSRWGVTGTRNLGCSPFLGARAGACVGVRPGPWRQSLSGEWVDTSHQESPLRCRPVLVTTPPDCWEFHL